MERTNQELDEYYDKMINLCGDIDNLLLKQNKTTQEFVVINNLISNIINSVDIDWGLDKTNTVFLNTVNKYNVWKDSNELPWVYIPDPIESMKTDVVIKTQQMLDNFARTRNYDSILSACTYATSTNPKFSNEGQYCVSIRDLVWGSLYTIMNQIISGEIEMPASVDDIISMLPEPVWPN